LRKVTAGFGSNFRLLADSAVMGLVLCGVMRPEEFAAWYGPFARVIPVESLGEGMAPAIRPAPLWPWGRLLTRVRSLEAPDWQRIVAVHDMLIDAVGKERHMAALGSCESVIGSLKKAGPIPEYEVVALGDAMDEIATIGEGYTEGMERMRQTMDSFLQRKGVGEAQERSIRWSQWHARDQSFVEAFRHCCVDGLWAVAFEALIPEQDVSYLYAPFEGFIPIESLVRGQQEAFRLGEKAPELGLAMRRQAEAGLLGKKRSSAEGVAADDPQNGQQEL